MRGGTRYTIGELARGTGLSVKVVRFYSDRGLVPPADRSPAGHRRYGYEAGPGLRRDPAAALREQVDPAVAAGLDPPSADADELVAAVAARYAAACGQPDGAGLRRRLLGWLEAANDPRRERYLRLLSVINGWSRPEPLTPALDWSIRALRARLAA